METIGTRLFELRKDKNITQEQLAEELGVSRQSVSNWELDKSLPDTERLFALAKIYDVSLDYIANGLSEEEQNNKDQKEENGANGESEDEFSFSRKNINILRNVYMTGILICTLIIVPVLAVYISIMSHLAQKSDVNNSDVAVISQVIEQYTYAEIVKLDSDGNYAKDRVWLDTRNVNEDSYIFTSTSSDNPKSLKFEYYKKTMMIPFVLLIALVGIDIIFIFSLIKTKMKSL